MIMYWKSQAVLQSVYVIFFVALQNEQGEPVQPYQTLPQVLTEIVSTFLNFTVRILTLGFSPFNWYIQYSTITID